MPSLFLGLIFFGRSLHARSIRGSRGKLDGFEGSLPEAAFRRGGVEAAPHLAICAGTGKLDEHGRIMAEGDGGAKGAFHAVSNQVAVAAVAQGRSAL